MLATQLHLALKLKNERCDTSPPPICLHVMTRRFIWPLYQHSKVTLAQYNDQAMSWLTEKSGFDVRRRRNIASLYRKLALKCTLKCEWTDYSVSEDSVLVLIVPSFGVFINSSIVNEIFV